EHLCLAGGLLLAMRFAGAALASLGTLQAAHGSAESLIHPAGLQPQTFGANSPPEPSLLAFRQHTCRSLCEKGSRWDVATRAFEIDNSDCHAACIGMTEATLTEEQSQCEIAWDRLQHDPVKMDKALFASARLDQGVAALYAALKRM
ncbi:unnamed protein product, partial [Chrysoparadoxa australica]